MRAGKVILVLSDRHVAKERLPIHALFAIGAVHHALIDAGLRCNSNIVVDTGTARDPHHYACLIGYGATAVYPVSGLSGDQRIDPNRRDQAHTSTRRCTTTARASTRACYKVLSKMGISTVASYRGSQLFEAVGIRRRRGRPVPARHGVSRIKGASFEDFESDQKNW